MLDSFQSTNLRIYLTHYLAFEIFLQSLGPLVFPQSTTFSLDFQNVIFMLTALFFYYGLYLARNIFHAGLH